LSSRIIKNRENKHLDEQVDIFFSEKRFLENQEKEDPRHDYFAQLKKQAHEEAERIVQEAKKQAVVEQQSGFEKGLCRGLETIKPLQEMLAQLISEMKYFIEQYPSQLEPQVMDLVINICSKIIKDKLASDRKIVLRTVQHAFKELTDKECIKIRVHAGDVGLLRKFQPQLLDMFHEIKKLEVVSDDTVDQGGCIIETNEGNIDATIRNQLKKLSGLVTSETFAAHMPKTS